MKNHWSILTLILLVGCQQGTPTDLAATLDQLEVDLGKQFPDWGVANGTEDIGQLLYIFSPEWQAGSRFFCKKYLIKVSSYPNFEKETALEERRLATMELLKGFLEKLTTDSALENNPAVYNVQPALSFLRMNIQQNNDASLDDLRANLLRVPAYYETAKNNLKSPTLSATTIAIAQNQECFEFLTHQIPELIKANGDEEEVSDLTIVCEKAAIAVKDYQAFCNSIVFELKKLEAVE